MTQLGSLPLTRFSLLLSLDGAQERTFQNQIIRIQKKITKLCMILSDYLTSLIYLPNNDLVMTKFGPRFELPI